MAKEIIWFRSTDGKNLSCTEGSVAFDLMSKDGSFTRIPSPGEDPVEKEGADDDNKLDLTKLSRQQLFEHAALNDVPVTARMKNVEIIAAIEAKATTPSAETAATPPLEGGESKTKDDE